MKEIILAMMLPLMTMANYSIGNKVWYDKNQDWEQSADEPGYANVMVNLVNDSGDEIAHTKTDAKGNYQFKNKPEGEYSVTITPPKGTILVTESPIGIWLEENRHDISFGIFEPMHYSISGTIWSDKNRDWEMDINETKVSNIKVVLYNSNGTKIATTKTNANGIYKFSKITEGEYSVNIISSKNISTVTEAPLGLWVDTNRDNINFGILISTVATPPITRKQLIEMILNDEDITNVNTSRITDMHFLFLGQKTFNQDISNWNVSNVTDMRAMFYEANKFNQNLNQWDVSKVTNMDNMFYRATSFNQPLSKWNTSNVTSMKKMFFDARSFNQSLDQWNVSKVKFHDSTFKDCPIKENCKPKFN